MNDGQAHILSLYCVYPPFVEPAGLSSDPFLTKLTIHPVWADWADDAYVHLENSKLANTGLLALPDWMPEYLFRKINIPAPVVQPWLTSLLEVEANTAASALSLAALATLARPVMRYFRFNRMGSGNRFWQPSLEGTLWQLLSSKVLIQMASAETLTSSLGRGFILTNISPWLRIQLPKLSLPKALANIPAHALVWQKLLTNMAMMSAPVTVSQQPIAFNDSLLNQFFSRDVAQPAL